jgi:hypothetical protein
VQGMFVLFLQCMVCYSDPIANVPHYELPAVAFMSSLMWPICQGAVAKLCGLVMCRALDFQTVRTSCEATTNAVTYVHICSVLGTYPGIQWYAAENGSKQRCQKYCNTSSVQFSLHQV